MRLYSNKKSKINIAYNLVRQDQMKHIEIDKHFIKKKLGSGLICTPYFSIYCQLANILIKGLSITKF